MAAIKERLAALFRRLERRLGIDREGPERLGLAPSAWRRHRQRGAGGVHAWAAGRCRLGRTGCRSRSSRCVTMTLIASIYLITSTTTTTSRPRSTTSPGGGRRPRTAAGSLGVTATALARRARQGRGEGAGARRPRRTRARRGSASPPGPRASSVGSLIGSTIADGWSRVVPDLLIGNVHGHRGGERFATTEVASEPRVRAARHLDANAMTAAEDVGGGPERDLDVRHAVLPALPRLAE